MCSHVWLFATPWTAAHQAPLSMEFSRQEYWSRLPFATLGKSFPLRDWNHVSCISRQILYHCTTWEVPQGTAFWLYIPTGCLLIKVYSQKSGCWEILLHRSLVFQTALWLYIKFKPKMCLCQGHNCICDEQPWELRWCLFRKKEQTY